MKILHLAPLWFPISQDSPGGIETYLPQLIQALEKRGCKNALIASGDSHTAAELLPVVPRNLCAEMEAGAASEYAYYEQHQLLLALQRAAEFDVVHSHLGSAGYCLSAAPTVRGRILHTQHNPVYQDLEWFVRQHSDMWFSTVSEFQARKLWQHGAIHCRVIPNGIDMTEFPFQPNGAEGLLFIGRIEWQKGPDLAVQAARAIGSPLTLAGPIVDSEYYESAIEPFLDKQIEYVGVVGRHEKTELFGRAGCALLPSRWDEPFGLVAIEAMACGTPVVALANGALSEVIEPGQTGYLADDAVGLPGLVIGAMKLDRSVVRSRVAARFDIPRVAEQYDQLYSQIVACAEVANRN